MFSIARDQRALRAACVAVLLALSSAGVAQADPVTDAEDSMFDSLASLDVSVNQALEAASAVGATCSTGAACGWVLSNKNGRRGEWQGNNPQFSRFKNTTCPQGNWNDCISSIRNNGQRCHVYWHWDTNYNGGYYFEAKGTESNWVGGTWDNQMSSNHWCRPE